MNKLHLTKSAQRDLLEIKRYISETLENPVAALGTVTRITQNIRMLETFPDAGTPLSALQGLSSEYRYIVSGNYLVFYRTESSSVYIDRVLYGRRDYLQILFGDAPEEEE